MRRITLLFAICFTVSIAVGRKLDDRHREVLEGEKDLKKPVSNEVDDKLHNSYKSEAKLKKALLGHKGEQYWRKKNYAHRGKHHFSKKQVTHLGHPLKARKGIDDVRFQDLSFNSGKKDLKEKPRTPSLSRRLLPKKDTDRKMKKAKYARKINRINKLRRLGKHVDEKKLWKLENRRSKMKSSSSYGN